MLFRQRFHAGIRDGSITHTYRTWKTPRVRVGASYRFGGGEDAVEVLAVDAVALASITAAAARRCGFSRREELFELLHESARDRLTARSKVFRVRFRHVQVRDARVARRADTGAAALDEVAARLERIDQRSRRGPWTAVVLGLIERHPRVAASRLAPRLERETRAFKADVRKLEELGLTESHEVGYSLSERGKALLARRRNRG